MNRSGFGAALAVWALLATPAAPDPAEQQGTRILAGARAARRLDRAATALRSRPVTLRFGYSPNWQTGAAGTLDLEFGPGSLYTRREHFPWQRFHTSESTVGDGIYRSWSKDAGGLHERNSAAAEANARPAALSDWIGLLHATPAWSALGVKALNRPGEEVVMVVAGTFRAELRFDPKTHRLQQMTQAPIVPGADPYGAVGAPGTNVHRVSTFSQYRSIDGVWWPGVIDIVFRGGKANVDGTGFRAVLKAAEL